MSEKKPAVYVIADADEGVQLNQGVRLGFAGAGFRLPQFDQVSNLLKQLFGQANLAVAVNAENDWFKQQFNLDDWEQVDAIAMQHTEALADRLGLTYAGFLPFADPKELMPGVKGHMVRPRQVHLANKICFTLGGGEQIFNLGQFVISADWVHLASDQLVRDVILPQLKFYTQLVNQTKLPLTYEPYGVLGEEVAKKNQRKLEKIGLKLSVDK